MTKIEFKKASRPLSEYITKARKSPVVVYKGGRPFAAVIPIRNTDEETLALSTNRKFLRIIEKSRDRAKREGTISAAELRAPSRASEVRSSFRGVGNSRNMEVPARMSMNTACLVPLTLNTRAIRLAVRLALVACFFALIPQCSMFPEFRKHGSHPYELRWDALYKDAETVVAVS